jgi:hypothetical protein
MQHMANRARKKFPSAKLLKKPKRPVPVPAPSSPLASIAAPDFEGTSSDSTDSDIAETKTARTKNAGQSGGSLDLENAGGASSVSVALLPAKELLASSAVAVDGVAVALTAETDALVDDGNEPAAVKPSSASGSSSPTLSGKDLIAAADAPVGEENEPEAVKPSGASGSSSPILSGKSLIAPADTPNDGENEGAAVKPSGASGSSSPTLSGKGLIAVADALNDGENEPAAVKPSGAAGSSSPTLSGKGLIDAADCPVDGENTPAALKPSSSSALSGNGLTSAAGVLVDCKKDPPALNTTGMPSSPLATILDKELPATTDVSVRGVEPIVPASAVVNAEGTPSKAQSGFTEAYKLFLASKKKVGKNSPVAATPEKMNPLAAAIEGMKCKESPSSASAVTPVSSTGFAPLIVTEDEASDGSQDLNDGNELAKVKSAGVGMAKADGEGVATETNVGEASKKPNHAAPPDDGRRRSKRTPKAPKTSVDDAVIPPAKKKQKKSNAKMEEGDERSSKVQKFMYSM